MRSLLQMALGGVTAAAAACRCVSADTADQLVPEVLGVCTIAVLSTDWAVQSASRDCSK